MRPLSTYWLRSAANSVLVILLVAGGAGLVRLLPWILSPQIPFQVARPFALALAAVAVETAFVIGIPVGLALGTAKLVARGELTALQGIGVSPAGILVRSWPPAALLGVAAFATSAIWDPSVNAPGVFAQRLVDEARSSCAAGRASSASVPLVGVTWLCFPSHAPRVVGPVPRMSNAWMSATALRLSSDLSEFRLENLKISAPAPHVAQLRLSVRRATLSGFSPWSRPPRATQGARALVVALGSVFPGLAGALLLMRRRWESSLLALGLGVSVGLVGFWALRTADRWGSYGYLAVPLAGLLWAGLVSLLSHGVLFRRWHFATGKARC